MKDLQELPKLRDSISYIYLEHAIIEQGFTMILAGTPKRSIVDLDGIQLVKIQ